MEYLIYGITYVDRLGDKAVAVSAGKDGKEAISFLEKALVEGKGLKSMKGDLDAVATETGYKTSKEGLIYGFDNFTNSSLVD